MRWFKRSKLVRFLLWVLIGLVFLFFLWIGLRGFWPMPVFSPCRLPGTTIVIDPGHGGADGGAVSVAGQPEAEINLAIAQRLDTILAFYGVDTKLTRTGADSIHDTQAKTLREKKVSDIHNRVDLVEKIPGALLISIHQNSYQDPKYHGMQVFYGNAESQALAQTIQENVCQFLDSNNTRQAMKIPASVYLMKHVSCRAILTECGFMSNPAEASLLQEADHQKKIAITIAAACLAERMGQTQ